MLDLKMRISKVLGHTLRPEDVKTMVDVYVLEQEHIGSHSQKSISCHHHSRKTLSLSLDDWQVVEHLGGAAEELILLPGKSATEVPLQVQQVAFLGFGPRELEIACRGPKDNSARKEQ